jgi:GTP-binding protein HflX
LSLLQEHRAETVSKKIKERIFADKVRTKMLIPYTRGDISSYLCEKALVESMEYLENGTLLAVELRLEDYQRYKEYEVV